MIRACAEVGMKLACTCLIVSVTAVYGVAMYELVWVRDLHWTGRMIGGIGMTGIWLVAVSFFAIAFTFDDD